jgi:hypothetical protein
LGILIKPFVAVYNYFPKLFLARSLSPKKTNLMNVEWSSPPPPCLALAGMSYEGRKGI